VAQDGSINQKPAKTGGIIRRVAVGCSMIFVH
jgi:hypothetical protein